MNVLLVSQPARDGVLRHVIGLVDFLLAQGDRVHLAYCDYDASDQLHALVDRVRAAGGRVLNLGVKNAPQPRDLPAVLRLLALIWKERPDVIHAHSSKAGALVRGLGLLGLRTPIFYTPNSYYRMHDPENRKARVYHALERIFGRVGTTITMSRCESTFAERVIGVPLARQLVSGNAVDFGTFQPATAEARLEFRARFGLPAEAKLIGSVGRFSLQKDPLTMYAAFADVARDLPDVHLVHLGQGELETKVDALIAARGMGERCHRLPYLNDSSPFYRALDGFILTSLYEGMSYAVLEALASNLPLVLTHAPGNDDFADHGFSHLEWCQPGDVASVSVAMRTWRAKLDRPEAPNHRAIARERFSLDASFLAVRDAYRRAALSSLDGGAP
jgi:glycosyltransferase involved in cell wall biosynthesis